MQSTANKLLKCILWKDQWNPFVLRLCFYCEFCNFLPTGRGNSSTGLSLWRRSRRENKEVEPSNTVLISWPVFFTSLCDWSCSPKLNCRCRCCDVNVADYKTWGAASSKWFSRPSLVELSYSFSIYYLYLNYFDAVFSFIHEAVKLMMLLFNLSSHGSLLVNFSIANINKKHFKT